MDMLIGEKQNRDWIELLIEQVENKEANFFSK
jgi:hypothetical protein